ncbi:hypothetical protein E4T81_06190 [Barnesiella sp. WM24]|uniref:hypothetical protein n=1 Tax=Barnesiella sp. WM24 TaxID=2558278 RepID=UPI0010726FB3|nr:hypothetical protein [Barnesiella sp. WM24]TFU93548.1 hypothetical protein E4T81_06190 [Barnesiella sp. WM24]
MIMISVIEKEYMETVIRMGKRLQSGQPDWEQRRYEIALTIYMKRREHILSSREDDARGAVEEANLLIAELKKTQDKK